jgi:hypothetical protein
MATPYKAPLRDMQFVMHEVLEVENHYKSLPHLRKWIVTWWTACSKPVPSLPKTNCPRSTAPVMKKAAPLNDGVVTTPKGFKEAYAKFVELGLGALAAPVEQGGQGLPTFAGHRHERNDRHRQLVLVHVPGPVARRDQHHRRPRHRRAEANLPDQAGVGRVDRHHVPDRIARRFRPGHHPHQGRAAG